MQGTERLVRFKFFLLILFILFSCNISAQDFPDPVVDSLLKSGIRLVVNQKYSDAEKLFTELNSRYPSLPLGKIYLAANKIAEAYDYSNEFDEEFIIENLESAKLQGEELESINSQNIWNQYYIALAEGYISYFEAIKGNWFSALGTGISSISKFEEILDNNNKFYEAYIAIGTFEYWKSRKLEFMNWLPFSDDTREIGIDLLIVAIDSSSYNSHLAVNSLIWIYIDQGQFESAINVADKALKEFPSSRTFKWGLARAYEEIDPSISIKLYKQILNSYPRLPSGNYINEITLKHLIAQQYAKIGDRKNAIVYCDEILSMKNLPVIIQNKMSDRIERVKELKLELTSSN